MKFAGAKQSTKRVTVNGVNSNPNGFLNREMTETMREEESVKKQISRCVKMLFLGIIMCLGMALSVHAEAPVSFSTLNRKSGIRKDFPGQTVRDRSGMPMNMEQRERLY